MYQRVTYAQRMLNETLSIFIAFFIIKHGYIILFLSIYSKLSISLLLTRNKNINNSDSFSFLFFKLKSYINLNLKHLYVMIVTFFLLMLRRK